MPISRHITESDFESSLWDTESALLFVIFFAVNGCARIKVALVAATLSLGDLLFTTPLRFPLHPLGRVADNGRAVSSLPSSVPTNSAPTIDSPVATSATSVDLALHLPSLVPPLWPRSLLPASGPSFGSLYRLFLLWHHRYSRMRVHVNSSSTQEAYDPPCWVYHLGVV